MKSFNHYVNNNYSEDEVALANEIAERLEDPGYLGQFLGFAKAVPHELLREFLDNACSIPDERVISSRAAIFVNSVNNYKRFGHGRARS